MTGLVIAVQKAVALGVPAFAHECPNQFFLICQTCPCKGAPLFSFLHLEVCHWFLFLVIRLVAPPCCSFFFSFVSPLFCSLVFFPFSILVSVSLVVTSLKQGGRVMPNRSRMMSLWSAKKLMRESSTSSLSYAWVQLSRKSWKRVHTDQSTLDGKELSSAVHPL
jgi:hypothetical protein